MLIDIGFGDHVHPPPKRDTFPSLLPGLPGADIVMCPHETVIAEKLEAMIRSGEADRRIKDLHDLRVITRAFPHDLATVVEAVDLSHAIRSPSDRACTHHAEAPGQSSGARAASQTTSCRPWLSTLSSP